MIREVGSAASGWKGKIATPVHHEAHSGAQSLSIDRQSVNWSLIRVMAKIAFSSAQPKPQVAVRLPSPSTIHYHIVFLRGATRSGIKFITSFMKPIMKSRLLVVEEIERGGASTAFSKIRYRGELHKKKPDRHQHSRALTWKLVSLRMFRWCFQFQFNIRFVQFEKPEFLSVNIFSSSFLSKTVCTFELISVNRPVTVQKRERKGVQLHLISCIGGKLIWNSTSLSAVFRRRHRN